MPTPALDSVAFLPLKVIFRGTLASVQQVKVTKLQRLTFDKVRIFIPQPAVLTGDNGCVKHCSIIQIITRNITFTDFLLLEV